jgi:hypothetical protein
MEANAMMLYGKGRNKVVRYVGRITMKNAGAMPTRKSITKCLVFIANQYSPVTSANAQARSPTPTPTNVPRNACH